MQQKLLWLVILGCLVMQQVAAETGSYRYIESSYLLTDIAVADGDGGSVSGSGLIRQHWILFGHYAESTLSGDLNGVEVDAELEFLRAGFGYRLELPGWDRTDGYFLVSYNEIDLTEFEDETESGEDFELGINHALRNNLELNVAARYFNSNIECIDLLAGDSGLKTQLLWRFLPRIGFSVSYEDIGNFNEWRIGIRGYL